MLKEELGHNHTERQETYTAVDEATEFILVCLEEMVDFAASISTRHHVMLKDIVEASKQSHEHLDEVRRD